MNARALAIAWVALPLLVGCPEAAPEVEAAGTTGKTVVLVPGSSTGTTASGSGTPPAENESSTGNANGTDDAAESSASSAPSSLDEGGSSGSASSGGEGSACDAPSPPCSPGTVETAVLPCGHCGTQEASRTCTADCTWGVWVSTTACAGQGCEPGETMTMSIACPCGDPGMRVATCSETCSFGEYVDVSPCNHECCSRVVYCDTSAASDPDVVQAHPGRGTWCLQTSASCSQAEALDGCLQRVASVCDALVESFYIEYL